MRHITVILPAHNEEKAITHVINQVRSSIDCRILVAASGCTDDTAIVAERNGAEVIKTPKGKGNAIRIVIPFVDSRYVAMLDSDGTYPADLLLAMVRLLRRYDAVMGVRQFDSDNMSTINRLGNDFITWHARLLYGVPVRDLCTGMWVFKTSVLKSLNLQSTHFTLEAELFVKLVKGGYKIGQYPIKYYPRIGEKKICRSDHVKIWWYLITRRFIG